ncbi:MAG TPA: D-2-hydroxyacid dehydrogenase [Vicinamibacterales bacterium]|jgi:phosphoglycerate dehydrogenase-like enzyme|nr:D-2-hydroxyacid dehydrogenase [Vicinamibacterales bacterium]
MTVLVAIYSPFSSWCIPDAWVQRLRERFSRHEFAVARNDADALAAIGGAEVAFGARINAAQFGAAHRLRWIHSHAAGVGGMLFPALVDSDVVLTNSRGLSAASIAEHTILVTLALFRGLPRAFDRQQQRVWAQDEFIGVIRSLRGARVLVVGLGAIGTEVARLAAAFGAAVTGIRRHVGAGAPPGVERTASPADLQQELPLADVVVLSAPQTPETVHLIGARELALMKDGAVFINVSRGKLVDEAALVGALGTGRLRGAALDVFEHEPLAPESPLWARKDVIVTPHVAGFFADYWHDVVELFSDNLRRYEAGEPLRNVVDKRAGY